MSISSISSFDPSRLNKLNSDKVTQKDLHDIKEYLNQLTDEIRYELQHVTQVQENVPKKMSQLENDLGYLKGTDTIAVPTMVSELENDAGYITEADVPKKVSELENDAGYITEAPELEWEELWTNSAPKTAFAAQTVAIENIDSYKLIYVTSTCNTSSNAGQGGVCMLAGCDNTSYSTLLYNTSSYMYYRRVRKTESGVQFATGQRGTSEGTGYSIPYKIYGLK